MLTRTSLGAQLDPMPSPSYTELQRRYERMDTYELLRIAAVSPEDYTPEAVEIAREIVARRSEKTDPQILSQLAEERSRESEGFWTRHNRQRGDAFRAGLLAIFTVMGIGLLGGGVALVLSSSSDIETTDGMIMLLVGLVLLTICIFAIRRRKRKQEALREGL